MNTYLGGEIAELRAEDISKQGFMDYADVEFQADSELARIMDRIDPKKIPNDDIVINRVFGAHIEVASKEGGKGMISAGREGNIKQHIEQDGKVIEVDGNIKGGGKDLLKVVARDKETGHIEAVESQYGSPVVGLQFHPEVGVKGLPASSFIYTASSEEKVLKNERIFKAFRESAVSFHNKKTVGESIKGFMGMADEKKVSVKDRIAEAEGRTIKETKTVHEIIAERKEKKSELIQQKKPFYETIPLFKQIGVFLRKSLAKGLLGSDVTKSEKSKNSEAGYSKDRYNFQELLLGNNEFKRENISDIRKEALVVVLQCAYENSVKILPIAKAKEAFINAMEKFLDEQLSGSITEKEKSSIINKCAIAYDNMPHDRKEQEGVFSNLVKSILELLGIKKSNKLLDTTIQDLSEAIKVDLNKRQSGITKN